MLGSTVVWTYFQHNNMYYMHDTYSKVIWIGSLPLEMSEFPDELCYVNWFSSSTSWSC
jgi:hypothetical protein